MSERDLRTRPAGGVTLAPRPWGPGDGRKAISPRRPIGGQRARSRARRWSIALASLGLAGLCVGAVSQAGASPLSGVSTVQQRLGGDEAAEYSQLSIIPGENHIVREELAPAGAGREDLRESLIYFGQLSDFQLADEESPSRVEFFDGQPGVNFSSSGHRPHETLTPHQVEAMIRQMNAFGTSPVPQGDGSQAAMDNVIATGDLADSMQRNETEWVLELLEGSPDDDPLDPGSGKATGDPLCNLLGLTPLAADFANPARYTGVQDYDDYLESQLFWDPDNPLGPFKEWPTYPGLVDIAQLPFQAQGLNAPSYVAVGNHDVLVQGNEDANVAYELVATGCIKPMGPFPSAGPDSKTLEDILDPAYLAGLLVTDPTKLGIVPPDPNRQYADKAQQRAIYTSGSQSDDHGFAYVDPAELAASRNSAMYYSFNPEPGIRFIALDTNTTGGGLLIDPLTGDTTAEGNIDHPQFRWLRSELEEAEANDELVVTYAHHASTSMDFSLPDELALPCLGINDGHGHDINPGCDTDPRSSSPIHTSGDFVGLLSSFPNVITHVAGHSHENEVIPHVAPGGGFWEIKSPAVADWPAQSRLLEVMDNKDGTLSIFGTLIDHDSPADAPDDGTDLSGAGIEDLASLGRELSFNDEQVGHADAEGNSNDRNVELVIGDPRGASQDTDNDGDGVADDKPSGSQTAGPIAGDCQSDPAATLLGTLKADRLTGDARPNLIRGRKGADRIRGEDGDDCIRGARGNDRIHGGAGNDEISGSAGSDRLVGGPGTDVVRGGLRGDRIKVADGEPDVVHCGKGSDKVVADSDDELKGCEQVRRVGK